MEGGNGMTGTARQVRVDAIPAGAAFYGDAGALEWIALESVRVETDGSFTLHVRHYPDMGDGCRRWSAEQAGRELTLVV